MKSIAIGMKVRAEMHDGTISGEVTGIDNRKVTIQADQKRISENGQELVVDSNQTVTLYDRNITEVLPTG